MNICGCGIDERQRLAYRLLPGEEDAWLERKAAQIRWSRLSARHKPAQASIVLLHGAASNASRWEEFIEATPLKEHFDIIRLDLRGHASSLDSQKATIKEWCADLESIFEAAGLERAIVIGHSLGAQIAMHFAARFPHRLTGLVLLDPLVDEALTKKAQAMKKRLPLLRLLESAARFCNALGIRRRLQHQDLKAMDARARRMINQGGRELEAFVRQYSSPWEDLRYIHAAAYLRDMIEVGRATPAAASIACPTLVIGASSGTYTNAKAMQRWVEKLPQGQVANVQCVHWPLTECPADVSRVIEKWIAGRFDQARCA